MTAPDLPPSERKAALFAGLFAYFLWGFVPILIQQVGKQGPQAWEILTHRVIWGAVTAGILVLLAKQGPQVLRILTEPRTVGLLLLSASFVGLNWVLFIYAVNNGKVLETSLGYYINPLVNIAAGAVIFREKLGRIALVAIALAAIGVAVQAVALGHLPWISLILAFSFGAYGVVRKWVSADAQAGLFVECLLLGAPALAYIAWLEWHGGGHFTATPAATFWLIMSGPITAGPLALFSWAARRMPLSAMGFLQFIAPTISFFTGVAQGEPFRAIHAVSFAFIWLAAIVFMIGAVHGARVAKVAVVEPT